ncbi:hypothetical protein [Halanaerobium praevalens]|uniref:hypothetical protein n=1 Tax=Halanaerobium praevalens TaxID=2331 RepID=UPI0003196F39|nr:hypothetical protein [Halanaerobium praevalens]
MPLADFIKSSFNRLKRGEKISSYALIFSKKQMFDLGARPVVYGTSISCRDYFDEGGHRLLDPNLFHSKEMYRYISFNLSRKPYPIDWTHEREWRWANYDYINYGIDEYYFESTEIDEEMEELLDKREMERIEDYGLNLDKTNLKGVGILVKNEKQAEKIVRDILWLVDSKKIDQDLYSYILLLPDVNENINT